MRKLLVLLFVLLIAGVACSRFGEFNQMNLYVLLPSERAESFANDLAAEAMSNGLTPRIGQATSDEGRTLHVVEASSTGLRLWSQNMPLSGRESGAGCSASGPRPDPGQFIVTVEAKWPFMGTSVKKMAVAIKAGLQKHGYDVRAQPAACSGAAEA